MGRPHVQTTRVIRVLPNRSSVLNEEHVMTLLCDCYPNSDGWAQCKECGTVWKVKAIRYSAEACTKLRAKCPGHNGQPKNNGQPNNNGQPKKKPKYEKVKPAGTPSFMKRVGAFGVSSMQHLAKGMPTCTQEQINNRLSICEKNECGAFTGTHCQKCGCGCSKNAKFLNKLAWADQECPVGLWTKVT